MLPHIDQALYIRFKNEGYRKKKYAQIPVRSIDEIVQLGYLDVNRTIRGIEPAQRWNFKDAVISFINDFLTTPPENQQSFDLLHHQCCQKCLDASVLGTACIHYGQAQKLLNMSLKYLYNEFAAYYGQFNYLQFPDNNVEHFFHLPIDSQIRSYLLKEYHFCDPTSLPWSQWNHTHYNSFQVQLRNRIRNGYKPLEVDYILWNTRGASLGEAMI